MTNRNVGSGDRWIGAIRIVTSVLFPRPVSCPPAYELELERAGTEAER